MERLTGALLAASAVAATPSNGALEAEEAASPAALLTETPAFAPSTLRLRARQARPQAPSALGSGRQRWLACSAAVRAGCACVLAAGRRLLWCLHGRAQP